MIWYTYNNLEEDMKEAYHDYLMRVSDVINFAGVCRRAGVNYTNFRQFMRGKYSYLSIDKLDQICEVIKHIEKIA